MLNRRNYQQGFTIMEILVATTIFATSVSIMMVLFNYTLRINRQVDAQRQSAQGIRNFAEFLVREIRNGRVNYTASFTSCTPSYGSSNNTAVAITNRLGEVECFFTSGGNLYIEKAGSVSQINPANLTVDPNSFRFLVRPTTNPNPGNFQTPGIQPLVTMIGKFSTTVPGVANPVTIPYQTVISPDVYDIPDASNIAVE